MDQTLTGAMAFEELDPITRGLMLQEFEIEEAAGAPYRAAALSPEGRLMFAELMRTAIQSGTERTLAAALARPMNWLARTTQLRRGSLVGVRTNIVQSSERLAITEFNTWYVRGLANRLLGEGEAVCEVYRAANPKWQPADCSRHEGAILSLSDVYAGHRRRYWPEPGVPNAISVPL